MIDLVPGESYYEKVRVGGPIASQLFMPGYFYYAPISNPLERNPALEIRMKYNQQKQCHDTSPSPAGWETFDEEREPVKTNEIRLRAKDRAILVPVKKRPVIVLTTTAQQTQDGTRHFGKGFLVAPMYSFAGDNQKTPYTADFIERVKAYCFDEFFYLPSCDNPAIKEGFVRFDRIQTINREWLQPRGAAFGDKIFPFFQLWLWHYLGADLGLQSEVLFKYREAKMVKLGIARS